MREFLKSLYDPLSERLKNRYLFTFSLSWIIINYRILLILIYQENSIVEKIEFIDTRYWKVDTVLYYPLLTTLIVLFLVPYLNSLVDIILVDSRSRTEESKRQEAMKRIEYDKDIAIKKFLAEKAELEQREGSDSKKIIERYEKEIKDLKFEIGKLRLESQANILNLSAEKRMLQEELANEKLLFSETKQDLLLKLEMEKIEHESLKHIIQNQNSQKTNALKELISIIQKRHPSISKKFALQFPDLNINFNVVIAKGEESILQDTGYIFLEFDQLLSLVKKHKWTYFPNHLKNPYEAPF